MPAFLPAYLLASSEWNHPGAASTLLREASRLHREMHAPCTFFVRGQLLESNADDFRRARDELAELGDFQQCTYSCLPLKTVCQEGPKGLSIYPAGTPRQCRDDIARASDLMEKTLGARPVGVAGPLGYFRGLSDRPDLLEILDTLGIRFTRSWTRNARDTHPLAFETQPFRYEAQGFPTIVEIPGQGWPDDVLREALGLAKVDQYVRHVSKDLDYAAAKGLTWSYAQQDWCSLTPENDMRAMRLILEHAAAAGFRLMTHRAYAESFPPA